MHTIKIDETITKLVEEYAPKQDIGGYSNLKRFDLKKSSREEFQWTGIFGEAAFCQMRNGSIDKLKILLDSKNAEFAKTGKGDDGYDDEVMYCGSSRYIDIKSSHVDDVSKIQRLNLVIPQRELHDNQIYVAAFTVGKDRRSVTEVVFAGWCCTEDVKNRWYYDRDKWAVKVQDLRPITELIDIL